MPSYPDGRMNQMTENKKKTAVVTGASSGIGQAVCLRLCGMGFEVFGFGRDFDQNALNSKLEAMPDFHPVVMDLCDTAGLEEKIREIRTLHTVDLLVNAAGAAYYGLHETLNAKKISEMVRVNLEVPMILTQLLLRDLKKNGGMIVNISSVTAASSNPHGCAYGATKAGLSSFGRSLFDEARKYGLKVVTVSPDMTQTRLYRHADFEASDEPQARLLAEDVAEAVAFAVERPETMAVTEMVIRPQLHRIQKKS